jgi:proline iminopeptidase
MRATTTAMVPIEGAGLWTSTSGDAPFAAVLCHGGPGLSDNLGPVAAMIDDLVTVHRYDQRASGRSTGEPPFTVERFVDDLESLRLHWEHPTWIVGGHSWGGWLALMYALRFPDQVRGLIAIGTPPPPSEGWRDRYIAERDARMDDAERSFYYEIRRRRHAGKEITDLEEERWTQLQWRTDLADPTAMPEGPLFEFPVNYDLNKALVQDMDSYDSQHSLLDELGTIAAPAVFIHGSGDPRPAPRSVVATMPNATLVEIEGAGHLPWLEQHDDVANPLRASVRRMIVV